MKRICLFGLTASENFITENIYLHSNIYCVQAVVSNEDKFKHYFDCYYYSFDEVDIKWISSNCDEVIICRSDQCANSYLYNCIVELMDENMTIINYHHFDEIHINMLCEKNRYTKGRFVNRAFEDNAGITRHSTIPVIFVAGIEDDIDNLKSECDLVFELLSRGYKVQWYCSHYYGEIFGANTYSEDAYISSSLDAFQDEIFKMLDAIESDSFDVVVMGIPTNWYAKDVQTAKTRLLVHYFQPDYIILNIYHNSLCNNTVNELVNYTEPCLGKQADMLVLTSGVVDIVSYEIFTPHKILHTGDLNDNITDCEKIVDILQNDYAIHIVNDIEERLT